MEDNRRDAETPRKYREKSMKNDLSASFSASRRLGVGIGFA
jgi:hypothetical protein